MGRRHINRAFYDTLLQAFRTLPDNYAYAARQAGCDQRTAKTGWLKGWPVYGFPPIKDTLDLEKQEAHSRLEQVRQDEQRRIAEQADRARNDAIQIAVDEVHISRATQVNAMAALKLGNKILLAMQRIYDFMHVRITQMTEHELRELVDDPKRMAHYNRIVSTGAYLQSVARQLAQGSMDIERTRLGKPTQVIGVTVVDMTMQEFEDEMRSLEASFRQAKEDGLLPPARTIDVTNGTPPANGAPH